MTRPPRLHRGFATATALTLLAFVAVLLTALGASIGMDVRRTREAAAESQLRQLLLVGAAAAGQEAAAAGATTLALPSNLTDDAASLTIHIAAPSESDRTATIDASFVARRARQVVRFTRRDGGWRLMSATVDPE